MFFRSANEQLKAKITVSLFRLRKYVPLKTYFFKRVPFICELFKNKVDSLMF